MVKYHLTQFVDTVDVTTRNQIWFSLSCFPGIQFGGVYIYPNGSPFYDELDLANVHAKLANDSSAVLGDLNARFGRDLIIYDGDGVPITYENKPDTGTNTGTNTNGNRLATICNSSNVAIVNNLSYKGRVVYAPMTYRQGKIWTSELDLALMTPSLVAQVDEFKVDNDVKGSDLQLPFA